MTTTISSFSFGGLVPLLNPSDALVLPVKLPAGVSYPAGQVLGQQTAKTAPNEIQTATIGGTPTGGTFRLVFAGQTTAAIAFDATGAVVQAALEALSTIGTGNVLVGLAGAVYTCTFQGACANLDQPPMTAIASLTGGTNPSVTIATTQVGNPGSYVLAAYDDALSDGTQTAKAVLQYAAVTDTFGGVQVGGGEHGEKQLAATAYFTGIFKTADLTGIDANGVADLGRLLSGTTSTLSASDTVLFVR